MGRRKYSLKAFLSRFGIICAFAVSLCLSGNIANAASADSSNGSSNAMDNDYSTYGRVIKSYLYNCSDGKIMRVEYLQEGKIVVEYYDSNYKYLSGKVLNDELPLFGGFYSMNGYYYILTGQKNLSENDSVEVYRITKYDTNWKRIGSCGLYGANTYIPFDAGSARMTHTGNYLIIRTCHEMYQSTDGYHHQANVTIEVDTSSMKITDSKYIVSNSGAGYISHSFNQFVKVANGKIVGLDHGDYYPRAIALCEYSSSCTSGTIGGSYSGCNCIDVVTFDDCTNYNYTGASIGGFEISGSNYLVAYNQEINCGVKGYSTPRDIYVAAVNRSSKAVTKNKITTCSSSSTRCSTPQFVCIGTDSYLLLWNQGSKVYYTKINASGAKVGSTYSLDGYLSDCQPILVGSKVVWYAGNSTNEDIDFYEINIGNMSGVKHDIVSAETDPQITTDVNVSYRTHVQTFGWQNYVSNGQMSGTSGQSKRLEGINIKVSGNSNLGIQYTTHVQTYGWLPWSSDDDMSGTEGEAKRLEAIMIKLTGVDAEKYDVYYRVHAQSYGWLGWAKNGAPAGTAGYAKRLEGIQIKLVPKGNPAPGSTSNAYIEK